MSPQKPSILVCDDEPSVQSAIRLVLERDYDLTFASDGEEALRQFQAHPADLVLLDIKMPKVDGMEVLKALMVKQPPPRVLMLTAYQSVELAQRATQAGAVDYGKPEAFLLEPPAALAYNTFRTTSSSRRLPTRRRTMPRSPRLLLDGGCYPLIARGNNRQAVFALEGGHAHFLALLARAKQTYPATLYHYCLMSNHFHLLLQVGQGADLPRFMQALLQGYGRWYQTQTRYVGHVWQGRYKSPLVAQESYFLEAGRYIERNPVRARMVLEPGAYPWSSYRVYAWGEPHPLVDEDPYYARLGATPTARQAAYRAFIQLTSPYDGMLDRQLLETTF